MKSRKRAFQRDIVIHCYQRTADGGLLFYTYSDYLVWFTHVCLAARRYHVTILAACPMPDHIHLSVKAASAHSLSEFEQRWTGDYAREYNSFCGTEGSVFSSPFGSAVKIGDKKARSNIVYVGNNPVERRLAERAEDYRVKFVETQFKASKPLKHCQLKRLFRPLSYEESQQLTDFIISTYSVIDYEETIRFFGSYDNMLVAMHSTTGSEHDLNEVFIGKTDEHFVKMVAIIMRELKLDDIHEILTYDMEKKYELFQLIRKHSPALSADIARFLHMPIKKV